MAPESAPTAPAKAAPLPDAWSLPYWEAARRHRLVMQRCSTCRKVQFPPDALCRWCQSGDFAYEDTIGRGTVYTFAVYTRSFVPGYDAPYVLALVTLADHPEVRMLANIVAAAPEDVEIDMAVEVVFEERGEWAVPQFRPESG